MSTLPHQCNGWTYGLDYIRISYDVADNLAPQVQHVARRRALELGQWCYKNVAGESESMPGVMEITTMYGSGWRVGRSVSVLVNPYRDRITEIVSGAAARQWQPTRAMMYNAAVTRLDVALDLDYGHMNHGHAVAMVDNVIQRWYDEMVTRKLARMGTWGRRAITYLCGADGGSTIYVNRRTSGTFVRIYNKSADLATNGIIENRAIMRVEIEIKGRGIKRIADPEYIYAGSVDAYVTRAVGYLTTMLELELPGAPDRERYYNERLDPSDMARSLEWVRRAVVPTLHRLASGGYERELRDMGITYQWDDRHDPEAEAEADDNEL